MKQRVQFTEYLSYEEYRQKLIDGTVVKASLHVNSKVPADAYARISGAYSVMEAPEAEVEIQETDIMISGVANRNRAIHGDVVGVRILPKDEWTNSLGHVSTTPCGRVVYVEKNPNAGSSRTYFSVLRCHRPQARMTGLDCKVDWVNDIAIKAVPLDRRIPWIMLYKSPLMNSNFKWLSEESELPTYEIFEVRIVDWKVTWNLPQGEILRHVGPLATPQVEDEAILAEYLLSEHRDEFDPESMDATQKIITADAINPDKALGRRDLRSCNAITIDPLGARDLDDAVHIKERFNQETQQKYYEVGVHVADVSNYVKPKSPIDKAALARSTTVYFPHRAFHMMPPGLATELCSLDVGKDKLTFSCIFNLDSEGRLMEEMPVKFFKSIIRTRYQLTYDEVQEMLEAHRDDPPKKTQHNGEYDRDSLIADLIVLEKLTQTIARTRAEGGCLSLNNAQFSFQCCTETWVPLQVIPEVRNSSHQLIEELMLLTNRLVATKLMEGPLRQWAVFRYQPSIKPGRLQEIETLFHTAGYADIKFGDNLGKCVEQVRLKHGPTIGLLLESLLFDSLALARYGIYGHTDFPGSHHYCLAIECYTHFTSPIRRYPDIAVHRLLQATLELEKLGYNEPVDPADDYNAPELVEMLEELDLYDIEESNNRAILWNNKKLLADYASDRAQNSWLTMFVLNNNNLPKTLSYVLQVQDRSCMVLVPAYNLKRRIEYLTGGLDRLKQKVRDVHMGILDVPESYQLVREDEEIKGVTINWGSNTKQEVHLFDIVPVVMLPSRDVPLDFVLMPLKPGTKDYQALMA